MRGLQGEPGRDGTSNAPTPRRFASMPTLQENEIIVLTQASTVGGANYRAGVYIGGRGGTPTLLALPNNQVLSDALGRLTTAENDIDTAQDNISRIQHNIPLKWYLDSPNHIVLSGNTNGTQVLAFTAARELTGRNIALGAIPSIERNFEYTITGTVSLNKAPSSDPGTVKLEIMKTASGNVIWETTRAFNAGSSNVQVTVHGTFIDPTNLSLIHI